MNTNTGKQDTEKRKKKLTVHFCPAPSLNVLDSRQCRRIGFENEIGVDSAKDKSPSAIERLAEERDERAIDRRVDVDSDVKSAYHRIDHPHGGECEQRERQSPHEREQDGEENSEDLVHDARRVCVDQLRDVEHLGNTAHRRALRFAKYVVEFDLEVRIEILLIDYLAGCSHTSLTALLELRC